MSSRRLWRVQLNWKTQMPVLIVCCCRYIQFRNAMLWNTVETQKYSIYNQPKNISLFGRGNIRVVISSSQLLRAQCPIRTQLIKCFSPPLRRVGRKGKISPVLLQVYTVQERNKCLFSILGGTQSKHRNGAHSFAWTVVQRSFGRVIPFPPLSGWVDAAAVNLHRPSSRVDDDRWLVCRFWLGGAVSHKYSTHKTNCAKILNSNNPQLCQQTV